MNQRMRTWLTCGCCALASAGAILVAQVTGWPPAVASLLEQVTQHVAEKRADSIFHAKAVNSVKGSARIEVGSSCIGFSAPCPYTAEAYIVDIDGDNARLTIRRYFDRSNVPAESIDDTQTEPCQLTSTPLLLSPIAARRFLRLLTLPHFLDFRRMTGNEPTDTAETHLHIVVNGRELTTSLLGPENAPERIHKLIGLVHTLGEGKVHLPQAWPRDKECRTWPG